MPGYIIDSFGKSSAMPTHRHYSGKEIQPFAEMNAIHIMLFNNNMLYRLYQNDFLGSRSFCRFVIPDLIGNP